VAGRAVANRSESLMVETPRGPVEVVRQQCAHSGLAVGGSGSGSPVAAVSATGGRDRQRRKQSAKRRCCGRGSGLDGSPARSPRQNVG
jgi:hypothetical protein